MNSFWITPNALKALFGNSYKSVELFGIEHIIELLIAVVVYVILSKVYVKGNTKKKRKILIILTVILWIDEIFKYAFTLATDQWMWNYLPLHLCSINIFLCTAHTFTGSDKLKDYLYCLCIPGAVLALLLSPWFAAPVFNAMHLHSYSMHVMLIYYALLVLTDGYRPNLKRIPYNGIYTLLIMVPVYFINKLLNTNFFFINNPDENIVTQILYGFFGNFYPISFAGLAIILWILMYLPWTIRKTKNA